MNLNTAITALVEYAKTHLGLDKYDAIYAYNQLVDFLGAEVDEVEPVCVANLSVPDSLIETLYSLANNDMEYEHFAGRVMGFVSPSPSAVQSEFWKRYSESPQSATDYLYDFGIKNFYIQQTAISKNLFWQTEFDPPIEITINLSKPEKDNKDIRKQLAQTSTNYPRCMLCAENLGYAGRPNYPARQTLRYVEVVLGGEKWFVQFSPYAYYYQHCIAVSCNHTPMKVDSSTTTKLLDFIDIFPHFFIGSNASLPIVGGSILSHEHFQGGAYRLPMRNAKPKRRLSSEAFRAEVYELDWYSRSIRITSSSRAEVQEATDRILAAYSEYSDQSIDLIARTTEQHNAATVIAFREGERYCMDIIFRNNLCNSRYPDGIYHAHPEHHNIKKEGIGLIEAAGLFILPARLKTELARVAEIVCDFSAEQVTEMLQKTEHPLHHHASVAQDVILVGANKLGLEGANKAVTAHVNNVCREILENISVFKRDIAGDFAFERFAVFCGLNYKD